MECGVPQTREQRRPRFASCTRLRSYTPNGSSNPNRSMVLPLLGERAGVRGNGASNCIVTANTCESNSAFERNGDCQWKRIRGSTSLISASFSRRAETPSAKCRCRTQRRGFAPIRVRRTRSQSRRSPRVWLKLSPAVEPAPHSNADKFPPF